MVAGWRLVFSSETSELALSRKIVSPFLIEDNGYDGAQDAEPPSLKP